jgi:organic hydroperoxide reductase OsmC/OhrA
MGQSAASYRRQLRDDLRSDRAAFRKAVEAAKSGCPISKLLNAPITMDAKLG